MQDHSPIFYKADHRSPNINGGQLHLLNSGKKSCHHVLPAPLGSLLFLDDIFLDAGQKHTVGARPDIHQVFLPLMGSFFYSNADVLDKHISAEEILILPGGSETCVLKNRFRQETVNYLHFGLKKTDTGKGSAIRYPVCLAAYNTQLSLQVDKIEEHYFASAGIYQSKVKHQHTVKKPGNGVFVYVLNGAFELCGNRMEQRDGCVLSNQPELCFESLSDSSILLLIEIPVEG